MGAHSLVRTQTTVSRTHLLIADNERVDGEIWRCVLFRLQRLHQLLDGGQPGSPIQSLHKS